jgi:hypothetical protein
LQMKSASPAERRVPSAFENDSRDKTNKKHRGGGVVGE